MQWRPASRRTTNWTNCSAAQLPTGVGCGAIDEAEYEGLVQFAAYPDELEAVARRITREGSPLGSRAALEARFAERFLRSDSPVAVSVALPSLCFGLASMLCSCLSVQVTVWSVWTRNEWTFPNSLASVAARRTSRRVALLKLDRCAVCQRGVCDDGENEDPGIAN